MTRYVPMTLVFVLIWLVALVAMLRGDSEAVSAVVGLPMGGALAASFAYAVTRR